MSTLQRKMVCSRFIAFLMLMIAYSMLIMGIGTLDSENIPRIMVFSSIIAIITISGIALWTFPTIEFCIKHRMERLLEVEDEDE